jgi:hypothetical protein
LLFLNKMIQKVLIGVKFVIMQRIIIFFIILLTAGTELEAQNGIIRGRVFDATNNEALPFANIVIKNTRIGATSDLDGNFLITGIEPGFVVLEVSFLGYQSRFSDEVFVTNSREAYIEIGLEKTNLQISEIEISASANTFEKDMESPVSKRSIGIAEIEKSPGANRDISKVIQTLPGVASTVSYRNDVIVRGGGASENRFYLDGVEIPNLNHFATQGASGGPVGIINVDFIRKVDFYSGAFPANRGNALSSVLEFEQVDGNREKVKFRGSLGASDLALTLDGPLSKNTSFVFSARRSYLQFLFSVIGLPFLPTYNDFQFKIKTRFNEKNELTILGLGAIDNFELNLEANESEEQRYILDYLPVNEQWNYTLGAIYKHFSESGVHQFVLSRNYLNNIAYKYADNDNSRPENLLFDYSSDEAEIKFRYEYKYKWRGYRLNYGAGLEHASYTNNTFQKVFSQGMSDTLVYNSRLDIIKYSFFAQASKAFLDEKLILSLGLRTDANTFDDLMADPSRQISPRASVSYMLKKNWYLNANTGRYYQLPAYTTLGYRNSAGILVNKMNDLEYIRADHFVFGVEHIPNNNSKITLEGFYKLYDKYPWSLKDSISLANKGGDYGTYGDEEVLSVSKGRAYGFELYGRTKTASGINAIFSYTFVRSEFKDMKNDFIPSAWDNKHIFNLVFIKNFRKNWQWGFKWRFVGGRPYTPYDYNTSSLISAWDLQGRGYLDYSRYNSERLSAFHQLDIRIDKEYFFKKWTLIFYVDIQNLYNLKVSDAPELVRVFDDTGKALIDPNDPNRYLLKTYRPESGTLLPTIGFIVEF